MKSWRTASCRFPICAARILAATISSACSKNRLAARDEIPQQQPSEAARLPGEPLLRPERNVAGLNANWGPRYACYDLLRRTRRDTRPTARVPLICATASNCTEENGTARQGENRAV